MEKLRLPDSLLGLLAQNRASADESRPWNAAYRERNFQEALRLVEEELQQAPLDAEPRLWWIILQLELLQVPLTALTAPLLEIYPSLKLDSKLHRMALGVFLSLAARLAEKNSLRLGVIMLEHAGELTEFPDTIGNAQNVDLRAYTLTYIHEELARAENRRENKDYIARLKQKEAALQTKAPPAPPVEKKAKQKKKPLSAKTIYTAAEVEEAKEAEGIDNREITPLSASAEETLSSPPQLDAGRPEHSRRKGLAIALVAALLCFAGMKALFDLFSPHSSASGELVLAMNTHVDVPNDLSLPNATLNAHDKLARKIESMNNNADEIGERIKQLTPKSDSGDKTIEDLTKDPGVDQAALTSKEAAKLKPNEPDELASFDGPKSTDVQAAPVDPRRTPRLDPAGLASIPVDRLDQAPRQPPERKADLQMGPDGRVYGPPTDKDPASTAPHDRTLDGSPLRSYEVEEFPEPLLYKTIASTNVLAAPSLLSASVSRLERDTTIHVVSKMGQWLELRSNQGRRGYIFAQDATPAQ